MASLIIPGKRDMDDAGRNTQFIKFSGKLAFTFLQMGQQRVVIKLLTVVVDL